MNIDIKYFKNKLEEEKKLLEEELETIASRNPSNLEDWEPKKTNLNVGNADKNESADEVEEYTENVAILGDLEYRYNRVKKALQRIENNTYGICEIGGEKIEKERLEANPATTVCSKHKK